jgi:hypothetical protein
LGEKLGLPFGCPERFIDFKGDLFLVELGQDGLDLVTNGRVKA